MPRRGNRERILTLIANELHTMGYRQMQARSLRPKHIEALVKNWQERDLSIGTIKNRMAAIRWWSVKINKQNVVARSNEHYGIPDRRFVTNESKAQEISRQQLNKNKRRTRPDKPGAAAGLWAAQGRSHEVHTELR